MKFHIKKGDTVVVIAGRERGKTGKVLSIDREHGQVLVEKLNMIKRHTKPNQKIKQGGIIEKESPLAVSNVMYFNSNIKKPVRLGVKILSDGLRTRVCLKTKEVIE
jgi:large subunit ribosomal protein L24